MVIGFVNILFHKRNVTLRQNNSKIAYVQFLMYEYRIYEYDIMVENMKIMNKNIIISYIMVINYKNNAIVD